MNKGEVIELCHRKVRHNYRCGSAWSCDVTESSSVDLAVFLRKALVLYGLDKNRSWTFVLFCELCAWQ